MTPSVMSHFLRLMACPVLFLPAAAAAADPPLAGYREHIRPLLAERCFACHGGLKQEAGLLTTYAGIAAMLGVLGGGYASDWLLARTGSKRIARQVLAAVAMATCAVLMALSFLVADVNAAIALISVGAFVACFGGVAGYTVAIDYGGDRVGTVFGAMNMAGAFGAMLFPVTVGWLVSATGTWNAALFAFVGLMAFDAVLWLLLNPRGRFMEPAAAVLACVVAVAAGGAAVAAPPGFNADVRPILADKCFRCHGPDSGSRQAGLRLDRRADTVAVHDGRAAVVPGDPAASTVHERIVSDDPDVRMPPPDAAPLTAAERGVITAWIAAGAAYEPHWAFVPPVAAPPPAVRDASSIRHPADRFIQARLERLGIAPEAEADPTTLCRRLHLDLVGLPPTPAEVDAFVGAWGAAAAERPTDGDPSARDRVYLALVDRLLASPRYGERMAGPWLDAARYADSNGYQTDGPRHMWRYRDWVIEAFNHNQPFDAFTIDQIAGDLLPAATLAQRIATGFNRNHRTNAEGGIIPAEFLAEYVVDRVETTCTVWLGLTAGCARCHDHKYDPLSQRDFYRLFDFFNRVPELGKGLRDANSPPLIVAPTEPQRRRLAELVRAADETAAAWQAAEPEVAAAEAAWVTRVAREGRGAGDDDTLTEGLVFRLPPPSGAGPHDPARSFDGTEPAAVDHVPPFDTERPFSATVRLEPTAADAATIYAAMDAAQFRQGFELQLVAGRPRLVIANRILDDAIRIEAEVALPADRWSHVTWTYDGSRLAAGVAFHVDGRQVTARVVTDELSNRFTVKQPLALAGGGTAEGYRGGLADLRFYDRVLDPDESAIISCGLPVADLVPAAAEGRLDAAGRLKLRDWFVRHEATDDLRRAWERMRTARKSRADFERALPTVMVMQDVPGLRKTHVLDRGLHDKPGAEVTAGVPESIGPALTADSPADRLALARWLVARGNPLTARVAVNRIWQQFFGLGLVKTVEDFGVQGDPPSHPELLDWLAVDFMDGGDGWDVKRLVRQIVTTAAYRRASRVAAAAARADPENRLLARGPRFRLPAETIRDASLAVSGLVVEQVGGPSVKPYQPAGLWEELAASKTTYEQDHGPDLYRRSLYVYRKRTVAVPLFATFDAAGRETCEVRQSRTNTPLQALQLLNDVTFVEAARGLGLRMLREGGPAPATRIAHGFRLAAARAPSPRELETLVAGFERR
ncbi:MAG: DUF1553 domain-containing protein, partial [Planctomycetia bacterium]